MLIALLRLSLTPLLIPVGPVLVAHGVGSAPPLAAVASFADSSTVPGHFPLTAELLTHYIALKRDLNAFWRTHDALLSAAQAHAHAHVVAGHAGGISGDDSIIVLDYITLTTQDPVLAALFTKHHVLPRQFELTEDAVYAALLTLVCSIDAGISLTPTKVLEQNAILVQPRRQALVEVGVHEEGPPGDD